jgi:hypothetical protein
LVAQAAGIADGNSRQALGLAKKFSDQRRAAEDRVAELESELTACQERAKQGLHRVYTEIEDRFLQQSDSRRPTRRNDPKIRDVRAEKDWLSALPPMCRRDARPSARM